MTLHLLNNDETLSWKYEPATASKDAPAEAHSQPKRAKPGDQKGASSRSY
jgi:hypothetical protein